MIWSHYIDRNVYQRQEWEMPSQMAESVCLCSFKAAGLIFSPYFKMGSKLPLSQIYAVCRNLPKVDNRWETTVQVHHSHSYCFQSCHNFWGARIKSSVVLTFFFFFFGALVFSWLEAKSICHVCKNHQREHLIQEFIFILSHSVLFWNFSILPFTHKNRLLDTVQR